MKKTLLYIAFILISTSTILESVFSFLNENCIEQTDSSKESNNNEVDKYKKDKLNVAFGKNIHFVSEFSEIQYFILHDKINETDFTNRLDLPPELFHI